VPRGARTHTKECRTHAPALQLTETSKSGDKKIQCREELHLRHDYANAGGRRTNRRNRDVQGPLNEVQTYCVEVNGGNHCVSEKFTQSRPRKVKRIKAHSRMTSDQEEQTLTREEAHSQ